MSDETAKPQDDEDDEAIDLSNSFDLTDVRLAFTAARTGDLINMAVPRLFCTEGRRHSWHGPDTDRQTLDYNFSFSTPSDDMPDQMSSSEHFARIEGTLPSGSRIVIHGLAWPWFDAAASLIDGEFLIPPSIDVQSKAGS